MSKVLINESTLQSIADNIRSITGSSSAMKPSEMATAIGEISNDYNVMANTTTTTNQVFTNTITEIDTLYVPAYTSNGFCQNMAGLKTINNISINSGVTDVSALFLSCTSLTDLPTIDMTGVTKAQNMFNGCTALKEVGFSNSGSLTNIYRVLKNCTALEKIKSFDTSGVTNFSYAFDSCSSLKEIPVFDMSSATNLENVFLWVVSNSTPSEVIYNIVESLKTATAYTGTKTLAQVGMSTTAQRVQVMNSSNWSSLASLGWSDS